ncbi:hypothetical protein C4559_02745 [Candidatus Microgenomates bacterium]|nr:MAG: hypothetical protein C4559_02745 [Candidatus Microgenomates bacterium]
MVEAEKEVNIMGEKEPIPGMDKVAKFVIQTPSAETEAKAPKVDREKGLKKYGDIVRVNGYKLPGYLSRRP